jgi:hypothetical protein
LLALVAALTFFFLEEDVDAPPRFFVGLSSELKDLKESCDKDVEAEEEEEEEEDVAASSWEFFCEDWLGSHTDSNRSPSSDSSSDMAVDILSLSLSNFQTT